MLPRSSPGRCAEFLNFARNKTSTIMQERIEQLKAELLALSAQTAQELEELRIKYISKKGLIPQLFDAFKTVPSEQKRLVGQQLNELKELATRDRKSVV